MRKLVLALLLAAGLRADVIIFENGDRLSGEVLTLTGSELKLRNEVQGVITLPRAKIASIHFREPAAAPIPAIPPAATPLKGIQGKDDTARAIELATTYAPAVDAAALKGCVDEGAGLEAVDADAQLAQQLALTGTPSVLVNGTLIANPSYANIKAAIDAAVAKAG